MKIVLFLSIVCVTALFSGCGTNRGGTGDVYTTSSGAAYETEPMGIDPSLPQDPTLGPGPSIVPP